METEDRTQATIEFEFSLKFELKMELDLPWNLSADLPLILDSNDLPKTRY